MSKNDVIRNAKISIRNLSPLSIHLAGFLIDNHEKLFLYDDALWHLKNILLRLILPITS